MLLLKGVQPAAEIKQKCAQRAAVFLGRRGRRPALAVVLVGSDPSSRSYVAGKRKACDLVGIEHRDIFLPETVGEAGLLEVVDRLNADDAVDGILVQLPLPGDIDEAKVIERISPAKDVDGFTAANMGNLLLGNPCLQPCTPKGMLRLLEYYGVETASKDVCIVGRSNIVGKPLAAMLEQKGRDATVTVCHSKTPDLAGHLRRADIIVSAVGRPGLIDGSMVKPGAALLDVGITMISDPTRPKGYRWEGDADFASVSAVAGALTPVPGGVGPMTIAMLMENTIEAAFAREEGR